MKSLTKYIYENNFHKSEIYENNFHKSEIYENVFHKSEIYENVFHKSEINEKLKINKDFNWGSVNKPKSEGKFLRLFISTPVNSESNRIDLEIGEYKFKDNEFIDKDGVYKQNKKGYYWTDGRLSGYWLVLALIDDDAIDFLNILLNDPTRKFNLFKYFDESQQKLLYGTLRKVYISNIFEPDEENIINLINKINEDVKEIY